MSEQLALSGFEEGPPKDRLFFAIFPDADAAVRIAKLARHLCGALGLRGRPLDLERLHVSLHYLGDYAGLPQSIVTRACQAAAAVASAPFEVGFDHVVSFPGAPGKRPIVLLEAEGTAALPAFQQAFAFAMRKAGLGRRAGHFTPHVTLLYDGDGMIARDVEVIRWTVREFVLVHSLVGRGRYIPLARWPLRDQNSLS